MRKFLLLFSTLLFAGACADSPVQPTKEELSLHRTREAKPKVSYTLTLLHNNDGESELLNLGGENTDFGGVDRFVTQVQNLRRAALRGSGRWGDDDNDARNGRRGVVLISSGDNFLAGPEFNASIKKGVPYYDAIAMRFARYDALAIGNHEFDFGPDVLADFIESFGPYTRIGSRFEDRLPPFLSANLDFSGEPRLQSLADRDRIAASTIVKKRGRRIGIIGATTPALPTISSPRNVVASENVAGAVQAEVDKLEAMGVNIIILTSHLQDIDEDLALIAEVQGVDIAIAGGGDELLANDGDLLVPGDEGAVFGQYPLEAYDAAGVMVPVVTTAGSYSYVGRLIAGFDKSGNLVKIDDASGPVRVAGGSNPDAVEPDPRVRALVTDPVQAAVEGLAANIIATSEVDLNGVRGDVRSRETNEGNLIADALRWQASQLATSLGLPVPDVGIQNGGGIRNDNIIPAGPVSELNTFDMVPFSNFVSIIPDISRAQFKEILENAVSRIESDLTGGSGRFAQLSGVSIVYDVSEPAMNIDLDGTVLREGTRIHSAILDDGTVLVENGSLVDGAAITIATIDFLARGGDQYPYRAAAFTSVGISYQQAVANYLVDGLGGIVTAADYPVGGEGRITKIGSAMPSVAAN